MFKSIILEGPNGSGKSNLGRILSGIYDLPYIHAGPSPGDPKSCIFASIDQGLLLKNGCILDRCTPISEVIYQPGKLKNLSDMVELLREYHLSKAVVIYCTHGTDKVIPGKVYYAKGHKDMVNEQRERIRAGYDELMKGIPHITWDWTMDQISDLTDQLVEVRKRVLT